MAAYLIFIRNKTTDAETLAEYGKIAPGTMAGHNGQPLVAYGKFDVLEGPEHEGMVILSFPTVEEARTWYEGPEYTAARAIRAKGAEYQVTLIEGI